MKMGWLKSSNFEILLIFSIRFDDLTEKYFYPNDIIESIYSNGTTEMISSDGKKVIIYQNGVKVKKFNYKLNLGYLVPRWRKN